MVSNPPENFPQITPYLLYEDVAAALDWLSNAFGFAERFRMQGDDGRVNHAEMTYGEGVVMMGNPGPDYRSPKLDTRPVFINVYVDDVDKHHAVAKEAGATIVRELEDQPYGDRTYAATDPEGHYWWFAQHVRDVTPEEMQQQMSG